MSDEFYQEWMKKCNPNLIVRFWRYKGSPGRLTLYIYGVRLTFLNTVFGELCIKQSDIFKQLYKGSKKNV